MVHGLSQSSCLGCDDDDVVNQSSDRKTIRIPQRGLGLSWVNR